MQRALDASPINFELHKTTSDEQELRQDVGTEEDACDSEYGSAASKNRRAIENDATSSMPVGVEDMMRPSSLINRTFTPSPHPPPNPLLSKRSASSQASRSKDSTSYKKQFQLTVDRSRAIFQDYVQRQPWWSGFHPTKSAAQLDLVKSVPWPGLSDISKRPSSYHRTHNKFLELGAARLGSLKSLRDWKEASTKAE